MVLFVPVVAVRDAATSDGFADSPNHAEWYYRSTYNPKSIHTQQATIRNDRSILHQNGSQSNKQTGD
jgi:hypothetical protein